VDLKSLTSIVAEVQGQVLTVTLNRPERMNAFNDVMRAEVKQVWLHAAEVDDIHAIVLRANGERAFATGVDLIEGTQFSENVFNRVDPGVDLSPKQNGCWKPMICAVHGMVAGGAFHWLNEADIIIASDDAQFFDPHVSLGAVAALEPIGLARRIPLGEVLRMVLLGVEERMSADRALQIGLVSEVVPREELWDRARQLAHRVAGNPPKAVQGSLRAVWESLDGGRRQALQTAMLYVEVGSSRNLSERVERQAVRRDFEVR
jgi:enoyl-CoA hydratase/carnithine racemase